MSRSPIMAARALTALAALTALMAACASAGSGVDPPAVDAPRPGDAAVVIDAPDLCPSGATCPAAMMLGMVSGDTGGQMLTASGHQSAWIQVRVTEDFNDPFIGRTLRVLARLTSPAAADYDVFVYLNAGSNVVECSTMVGDTTTDGNVNETRVEWGERNGPNGSNDGRPVSIEIRPVSGACMPGQNWQLVVEGNWN